MGVFSGRDNYSPKWITAEIADSSKRLWIVPIKYTIGDYFLTELDKQLYCFKIEPSRILTKRDTLTKSYRILQYDTSNYKPISGEGNQIIEELIQKNGLPKVNHKLYGILKVFSNKEKYLKNGEEFKPHNLQEFIEEAKKHGDDYKDQVEDLKNYLGRLGVSHIVTPTRRLVEFIEDDLLATDPKFLGDIAAAYQRTDEEHKKISNTPLTAKVAWAKIIAIFCVVGLCGFLAYFIYTSGILNNIIPQIGPPSPSSPAGAKTLMQQYQTPEALKAAIQRGDVKYSDLPPDMKAAVDKVKTPIVVQTKP